MSEYYRNPRDWFEPAHPGVIRLYDELIQVYRQMREQQKEIDAACDLVASQIGFVVTTTLPVRIEIGEEGSVTGAQLDGSSLRGTLFEKELGPFVARLKDRKFGGVPASTFRFYIIWYDALRLKLNYHAIEPPHVLQGLLDAFMAQTVQTAAVRPEVREPAHPPYEERDLLAIRGVGPGVREPAHPPYQEGDIFAELRAAIAKLRKS